MAHRQADDGEFGLSDPAAYARWARESDLIRQQECDDRVRYRHQVLWLLLVILLLSTIAAAVWFILSSRDYRY
jgi:hypothetical protein